MSRILIQDGTVVVSKVLLTEGMLARMCGLLGHASLAPDTGMLLRPCRSIHMWFMRFPIDAAFLDADLRVLKISRGLRPGQLAFAPRKTTSVLETAKGVMAAVNIGDVLKTD